MRQASAFAKMALFSLATTVALSSCSSAGFNREALQSRLEEQAVVVDKPSIAQVVALKPQLKFPFKLAVYFHPESSDSEWRWSMEDKKAILALKDDLKAEGILSDVYPIPDSLAASRSFDDIRTAAARQGADAVMVVGASRQTDEWTDPSGFFNILIVPAFLNPAMHDNTLFMMEATVWDVGNSYLYATAESEAEVKKESPVAMSKRKESIEQAKKQALEGLVKEIGARLDAMH